MRIRWGWAGDEMMIKWWLNEMENKPKRQNEIMWDASWKGWQRVKIIEADADR